MIPFSLQNFVWLIIWTIGLYITWLNVEQNFEKYYRYESKHVENGIYDGNQDFFCIQGELLRTLAEINMSGYIDYRTSEYKS